MAGAAGEAFAAPRPERAHASPCLWSPCPGCPAAAVLQECAVQGASMAGHDGGDSPGSASWGPRGCRKDLPAGSVLTSVRGRDSVGVETEACTHALLR